MPVFVFDLDDTLVLERTYVASGFRAVGDDLERRGVVSAVRCFDLLWKMFEDGVRGDSFDRLPHALGASAGAVTPSDLVRVYRNHEPVLELDRATETLVAQLRTLGPLCLVTDGPAASQRRKIAALGLDSTFAKIVVTDELGEAMAKPDPAGFQLVMSEFPAVSCEQLVYIGDNPAKDFLTPNRFGWMTVRLRSEGQLHADVEATDSEHRAKQVVDSVDALAAWLVSWASAFT